MTKEEEEEKEVVETDKVYMNPIPVENFGDYVPSSFQLQHQKKKLKCGNGPYFEQIKN